MIHIACAADAGFVPHCGAMLHSLLDCHDPAKLTVHFLYDDSLPESELARLASMAEGRGANWRPLRVTADWRSQIPDNRRFGRVAWYRILLPELLPDRPRVLYLDADAIVVRPLDALWRTPLDNWAVAAVANPLYPGMDRTFLEPLGVTPTEYFNSGVMLMNLDAWRREDLTNQVMQKAVAQGRQEWPDQNALNAALRRRWLPLHPRWNAQNTVFDLTPRQLPFIRAEIDEARQAPAIIHFIGPYKPWHYRCKHRLRHLYWQHLERTPWAGRSMEGRTLKHRLLRLLPERWGWYLEERLRLLRRRWNHAR